MLCLQCHSSLPAGAQKCSQCGVVLATLFADVLPRGTLLANNAYRIDHALGRGGFGIIYQAMHTRLDRRVAIKEFYPNYVLRPDPGGKFDISKSRPGQYENDWKRFVNEGKMLTALNHQHIVSVYDLFRSLNSDYMVMELLEGRTLRRELDKQSDRQLAPELIWKIVRQMVSALDYLHSKRVYHLDIKPDNIFWTPEQRAVLIDFGAAYSPLYPGLDAQFDDLYAPPEIALTHDKSGIGPQSDLFELGMTIYELLTGKRLPGATQRSLGRNFDAVAVDEPWRSLLTDAVQLDKTQRPADVRVWWEAHCKNFKAYTLQTRTNLMLSPDTEEALEVLQRELDEARANSEAMRKQLTQSQLDARAKEDKIQKLQETTQQKIRRKEKALEEAEKKISALENQNTDLEKHKKILEEKNNRHQKDIKTYQRKIKEYEQNDQRRENRIKSLESRLEIANNESRKLLDKIAILEEELQNIKVNAFLNELHSDDERIVELQKQLRGLRGRVRKLEEAKIAALEEAGKLENEMVIVREQQGSGPPQRTSENASLPSSANGSRPAPVTRSYRFDNKKPSKTS